MTRILIMSERRVIGTTPLFVVQISYMAASSHHSCRLHAREKRLHGDAEKQKVATPRAGWREEFVAELLSFPGSHDDQVDALTQGLAWGRQQWSGKVIVSFYGVVTLLKIGRSIVGIRSNSHAAATTSRHSCMAEALNARCVLADVRWRWTLKVL